MRIEKLTKEQQAKFPEYVRKWTEIGLCTKPANRKAAEAGIIKAYAAVGLAAPKIVWTTSPLASGLTREVLKGLHKKDFENFLGASVRDSVRDSVWASVGDSVRASVGASVGDSVWDSVGASVRASVGASGYGQHDAAITSYFEFMRHELGLIEQTEKWEGNREIVENAGWYLPHKNICWVSERHTTLRTDDRGRLHCEDGPALEYPDGFGIYAWHGTKIPEEWVKDKSFLTPEIALSQTNAEQRRCACEILGWNNVLSHPSLNPKVINEDLPHIGTLVQVDLPDAPKQWFIKFQCGTGRWFAEAVNDKKFDTALKANAGGNGWRPEFKTPPEQFIPFLRS